MSIEKNEGRDLALIPEEKIAEIRDRTDIVQVVGEYVSLRRSGVNFKGLCPFHQEKGPSFNVNSQRQFFHCFGCGKSGDVFTFLSEIEGKPFLDVARELGRRAGIDLPEPPRSREAKERARQEESERSRLVRLHNLCAEWYTAELSSPRGARARAYLQKRGIGDRVAAEFRVGYAPSGWDALVRHLEMKRVPHELCERAGLIRRRDGIQLPAGAPPTKATHFDVFVDRLVYALTSPVGEIIGFGGRVLDPLPGEEPQQPKYKNSPETLLYKKGENLFGLHAARHAIRRRGQALLVEGNFDVLTLHERGVDFAVAPQGTALTRSQVQLLSRFAREVVLMFDADDAGRVATMKAVPLFIEEGLPLRVAVLQTAEGQKIDPDELAQRDLPRLQAMLDGARDAVEFFFEHSALAAAPSVPGRVQALETCAPLLRLMKDRLSRDLYVDRLAELLQVKPFQVQQALRGVRQSENVNARENVNVQEDKPVDVPPRQLSPSVQKLLSLIAAYPSLLQKVDADLMVALADNEVAAVLAKAQAKGALDAHSVAEAPLAIRRSVAEALLSEEFVSDVNPQKAFSAIVACLALPRDRRGLVEERKKALERGDREMVQTLNARILASTRMQGETA